MREDLWAFQREQYSCAEQTAQADLNTHFTSRTDPLSTLDRGRSGLVKKSYNISTQQKLMSDSEASHDELQQQVFGALSDMGTEKGVADMSTMKPVIGTSQK